MARGPGLWGWSLALAIAGISACGDDPPTSDLEPGLRLRGWAQASRNDHLTDFAIHRGHLYAANSQGGVAAMRLEADGQLMLTDPGRPTADAHDMRCTTVAIHAASDTLYCAADTPTRGDPHITRLDLSEPGHPRYLDTVPLRAYSVRDLTLIGDRLILNQFQHGLWAMDVTADGQLGPVYRIVDLEAPSRGGDEDNHVVRGRVHARFTVALGERIVVALAHPGGLGTQLRLLNDDWRELDRLALAGPPLGLAGDDESGTSVVAALGSGGLAIVDLAGDELVLRRSLHPPAVVTYADLADDLVAAVSPTGAFAWRLPPGDDGQGSAKPRLFGFAPEAPIGHTRSGNMLYAEFVGDELLVTDWTWVERYAVEPEGEVTTLDLPRGVYLPPDGPARWRVRNPGPHRLRADFRFGSDRIVQVEVAPDSVASVELDAEARRRALPPDEPSRPLTVFIHDARLPGHAEPLATSRFVLHQRDPHIRFPPAPGDAFPPLAVARSEHEILHLPDGRPTQAIWYTPDCALMWPAIEDLAWLERHSIDLGRGTPLLVTNADIRREGFAERWAVTNLEAVFVGERAPEEVQAANADYGDVLRSFVVFELPGDSVTSDYVIDADGRVRSVERMYRGPWNLVGER